MKLIFHRSAIILFYFKFNEAYFPPKSHFSPLESGTKQQDVAKSEIRQR